MSTGYHVEDEAQTSSYDHQLMGRLLRYVRPYRGWFVFATVLLLIAAVLSNLVPVFTMLVIDDAIGNPDRLALREAMQQADTVTPEMQAEYDAAVRADQSQLLTLVLIMFALVVSEALIRYGQLFIVAVVGQKTMLAMRMEIFEHLQAMSLRFLDRHPVGRLMTRVTNDVEKIQATIVTGMVQVISDLFTVGIVLIFMLVINWKLALVTLGVIPLVFLVSAIFRKFAHRAYLEIRKKIAVVNANMQENVSGMQVVQAFGQEARQFDGFARLNADHRDEWLRQVRYYATYFPVIDLCGNLAFAAILLYGGHQILAGETIAFGTASIGMFFAYMQFAERLFQPIMAIADRYNLLLEAMASSERIFDLLDTEPDVTDKPEAKSAEGIAGAVEFRNVSFAYNDEQWVLRNINLKVKPGERVAIVGHTGAGKTTLSALLSRFYDVQEGQVLVDGVDVRDYAQDSLRRQIGVVLQDVFLFSGSIEDNIRLGDPDMDPAWVRSCAEYVNAARFIERHNEGYQYDVGERGCNLSTGQRQLLAFARTLAHNPRILVLDEATSSVDTETEALIQDAIHKLMEGRTSIVIAHRLSTVQNADRIVVMHHGEIHEVGTHQELLAQRGIYYRLYQLQYKDQASAA